MRLRFGALIFIASFVSLASADPRCLQATPNEPIFYRNDFKVSNTLKEMNDEYTAFYSSGKRIANRAYWDESKQAYYFTSRNGPVKIAPEFLTSITRHIEIALARGYVNFVYYPDMGHAHLYVPNSNKAQIDAVSDPVAKYEKLYSMPDIQLLYHTVELMKLRDGASDTSSYPEDRWLLWRYFSRNLLGDNLGGERLAIIFSNAPGYNTVRSLPESYEIHTLYFSASKDGCFPFKNGNDINYFDISMEPIPDHGVLP